MDLDGSSEQRSVDYVISSYRKPRSAIIKAFDIVSVLKLLLKMEELGIRSLALQIFQNYLTARLQCVRIDNHFSDDQATSFGVPQAVYYALYSLSFILLIFVFIRFPTVTSLLKQMTLSSLCLVRLGMK